MNQRQQNLLSLCDNMTYALHSIPLDTAPAQMKSEIVNLLFGFHTEREMFQFDISDFEV
jgi:hypothetical protein